MVSSAVRAMAVIGFMAMDFVLPASAATIHVGMDNEAYPPFYSKGADGTWSGWEIDLLHAVCENMKATCDVQQIAWDGLIPSLQDKKIDLIWSSMTINGERQKVIDFTVPYYDTLLVMIGDKSDKTPVECRDLSTFKNKVIGVQAGTNFSSYLDAKKTPDTKIKTYDTLDNALADLSSGRIDFVQEGKTSLVDFLSKNADFEVKTTCPEDPILGYGVGGGVRKDDTALRDQVSAAIKAEMANGDWDKITARYPTLKGAIVKPGH